MRVYEVTTSKSPKPRKYRGSIRRVTNKFTGEVTILLVGSNRNVKLVAHKGVHTIKEIHPCKKGKVTVIF